MKRLEFYVENAARQSSREVDYGWWQDHDGMRRYRVSLVEATGELYFYDSQHDTIEIIGHAGIRSVTDELLKDWPKHCGRPKGLDWLRNQVRSIAPDNVAVGQ